MRYSRLVHISEQIRKTLIQNPTFTSSSSSISTSHSAPNLQSHLQSCSRSFSIASQSSENASAAIADELARLTLLEVMDLVEVMQKKRGGVNELPLMMLMTPGMGIGGLKKGALKRGGGGGGAGGGAEEEKKAEKTAFDVMLDVFDAASKIKVIKEVRVFTSLGLKEAKDLVEKAPTLLKKGVAKEEAEIIIAKMKEVGAEVSME